MKVYNQNGELLVFNGAPAVTGARAYLSADQDDLADGVWTKVDLDQESYDIGADFNVATYKFVVPTTGYYLVVGQVVFEATDLVVDKAYSVAIYKGGALIIQAATHASHAATLSVIVTDIVYLAAADEIELYALSDSGDAAVDIESGETFTFLAIHLLSS